VISARWAITLISSNDEVSNRLIMMAEKYKAKAIALESDPKSPPAEAFEQIDAFDGEAGRT
jgi:hypothetical protein